MSSSFPVEDDDLSAALPPDAGEDDFEEISSDEVDRIVEALEALSAGVDSENIRFHLEEAALKIYLLIYGGEESQSEAA